ncbi:MAG: ABC transporter substrate-binding protein [Lachnospiraceae bacterium]|jgi:putative aldouronate transport system substrate-binding protein|nr:ABC transporter substrate-binding protein [Lachnospiraceae bacterium]
MNRKAVSIVMASVLAASALAGCGSTGTGSTAAQSDSSAAAQSGSAAAATSAAASGAASEAASGDAAASGTSTAIDMNEDPYQVAIQVVTLPGVDYSTQEEEMEKAIDAITLPAINCTVDIQFVWISEVANTTSLAIAGNEKVDLVHVATVSPLSSMVGSDMLYDMNTDNLLQNRGQKLVELFGDLLQSGNVDGQQLAIPAKEFNVVAKGIGYNKAAADKAGVTLPETGTLDDLDTALHSLKDKNQDMMGWFGGEGTSNYLYWLQGYEGFGTNAAYGAVMDSSKELKVENIYATQDFMDYANRMYKWRQDGILQKDSTDKTSAQDYFNAQQLFCYPGDITPQLDALYKAQAVNNGFEYETMQMVSPKITNASVTEYMWGIASNSERPDKAMDFLNFAYSNADVANILMYGLKDTNYTFQDGSDKIIETNNTYTPAFLQIGDAQNMLIPSPAGEDFIQQWKDMTDKATVSPIVGYMFSDADYQTESAAITNVINQYLPTIENGSCESEDATKAYVDEFVKALQTAGIDDVIAGNQEQMDAYLAAQK